MTSTDARALRPQSKTPYSHKSDAVEIVADFDRPKVLRAAHELVRATRTVLKPWLGDEAAKRPIRLHLYRTTAGYENAEQDLTKGSFRRNLAFAHIATSSAHVALQPEWSDAVLDALGPSPQTLRLVVHEAAHVARYETMANCRDHPRWLADGLATWAETRALAATGHDASIESSPSYAEHVHAVGRLLDEKRLPAIDTVLERRLEIGAGGLGFYEVYAVHALLFEALWDRHGKAFQRWVRTTCPNLAAGEFAASLREHVASGNLDAMLAEFHAARTPEWEQVFRVLGPRSDDGRRIQAAFDKNAVCWRTNPLRSGNWTLTGAVTLFDVTAHDQMNVLLGRGQDGFVSVAFVGGRGVSVMRYDPRAEQAWRQHAWVACDVPFGEPIGFSLRATTDSSGTRTLHVSVDGEDVARAEVDLPLDRPWGLGAQKHAVGVWHDVVCAER